MNIERDIINQFQVWKDAPNRKPILLRGARQIGKTWAMETFGKECFKYCVKFDFDRHPEMKSCVSGFQESRADFKGIVPLLSTANNSRRNVDNL